MRLPFTALAFACLSTVAFAQSDVAVLLDGSRIEQRVTQIEGGKVTFEGDAKPVDLLGLRRIERPVEASEAEASARVFLVGGGMIRASAVALDENHCTLTWAYGELKLPLSAVRGIQLSDETDARKLPAGADAFLADVNGAASETDRLYVSIDNKVQSLQGVFLDMAADKIKFQYEDAERTVDRARAFGLTLTTTGKRPELTGSALVKFADGSSLWVKIEKMQTGLIAMKTLNDQAMTLPWAAVQRLDVRSDRMMFLSDLEPVDVYEKAIAYIGPWQRDRSVRGKPLRIAGRTFDKGLGVHATSRLSFNVDPKFTALAATIGIDDETKNKGDCEFVVLGDGRELFKQRIRPSDGMVEIRVKLEGVKKLTLAVEAGEDLDFADHGDWGDVRLIRE
ncbi:MAG: NPCBM/NEW2 domain-containing protein [Phycisphaeraceae bacterium]